MMSRKMTDRRIVLNVGGVRHETLLTTLTRIPNARLALIARLGSGDNAYDERNDEFFFDRNPRVFDMIIHYYRTGEMHMDQSLCGNVVQQEIDFWGITSTDLEPCCWASFSKFRDNKTTLAELDENFFTAEFDQDFIDRQSGLTKFQYTVWKHIEDPSSSTIAKIVAIVSMLFVFLSIGVFVLSTHEWFRVPRTNVTLPNATVRGGCNKKKQFLNPGNSDEMTIMVALDYGCLAFFTLEFLFRFLISPHKLRFLRTPLNILDMLVLIPLYASLIVELIDPTQEKTANILKILLALRAIRLLRIFKLMKHYAAFKVLVYTIKVSIKELGLMVVFLFTGVVIFACIIHYVEGDKFDNIPIGIWWAVVTMTTVGYGDYYPESMAGFLVGCCCVICGVLTIAFTVPIVVNNFTLYYSHAQSRVKLEPRKPGQSKGKAHIGADQIVFDHNQHPELNVLQQQQQQQTKNNHSGKVQPPEAPRDQYPMVNQSFTTIPLNSAPSQRPTYGGNPYPPAPPPPQANQYQAQPQHQLGPGGPPPPPPPQTYNTLTWDPDNPYNAPPGYPGYPPGIGGYATAEQIRMNDDRERLMRERDQHEQRTEQEKRRQESIMREKRAASRASRQTNKKDKETDNKKKSKGKGKKGKVKRDESATDSDASEEIVYHKKPEPKKPGAPPAPKPASAAPAKRYALR